VGLYCKYDYIESDYIEVRL